MPAWIRGAQAAYDEERFFEASRNPYRKGTPRAKAWEAGYQDWMQPAH
jgi:hypothetical protein